VTAQAIAHDDHAEAETADEAPERSGALDVEAACVHSTAGQAQAPVVRFEEPAFDFLTDRP
jgi:hypothetical protein